ncbi:NAD(P)-dependent oxidoreductase [Pararhodobacter oceanensis]|uniref:NAD-dependent epimerase n=1 Tax=Pararhodobacter oceanensis TaxID=2172121 RepID=A0A2T8HTN6_9RHOB|nr:NAD(P)-binding oxidoreductase [Pararhodobacter oceanensis]PVH28807.1 NAD-dependent epimerase [Pararhodobacter oceanensis]
MEVLVVGASGATGRLLVADLLARGHRVRAVLRAKSSLPEALRQHPDLSLTEASLLVLSDAELMRLVAGCDAVASCLGHTLSVKGIYGAPRRLVTDATRRLCDAIRANAPQQPVKFVLMNTSGNRNRDLNERISLAQKAVIALLRLVLPPHVDNEAAAEYLRLAIGQNDPQIEWAVVRPDALVDHPEISAIEAHPSPIRSAIFNAGKISRINVAHFIADLITRDEQWQRWRGRMPVIYNDMRDQTANISQPQPARV